MPATTNRTTRTAFLVRYEAREDDDYQRLRTEAFAMIHKLDHLQKKANGYLLALKFMEKSKIFEEWEWQGTTETFCERVTDDRLDCLKQILEIQTEIKKGGFAMETLSSTHKESMLEARWTTGERH